MFAVLLPVGPGQMEVERLRDTLASLEAFEDTDQAHLILIDDSQLPRDLAAVAFGWTSKEVLRTAPWDRGTPDPYSAMVAGTIDGMKAAARWRPEFLLKLDTDALVIGPIAGKLRTIFATEGVGVVGSHTHTCTGARRDWSGWEPKLRQAKLPIAMPAGPPPRYRSLRAARAVRGLLAQAVQNGYTLGAHCLGGGYAVGPELLARHDLLEWWPWLRTGISEDIVVGVLAGVAQLSMQSAVGPGEVFGLAWQNLPLAPQRLLDDGYSVIHSVRDQAFGTEAEIRAFFRSRRASPVSG